MRRPCIITLLTDFGNQDAYVGIMKGVIAGINPMAKIVDICHNIPPQDIFNAAYLLYTSYKYFPGKTIHVAVVDPGVGSERDILYVEIQRQFFLVPDNGILSFIVQEERPKSIFRVTNNKYFLASVSGTFHGRDIFAPVAAHLSLGIKPQQLGVKISQIKQWDIPKPVFKDPGQVEGQIIHVDRFGNLVTNITREHLLNMHPERGGRWQKPEDKSRMSDIFRKISKENSILQQGFLEITVGKKKISGLSRTYTDVKPGKPLALFGSAGFLEISVSEGNARKHFGADRGSKISVLYKYEGAFTAPP